MPLAAMPTELLVDIFKHLDYISLKVRVPSTCRRFHAILNDPEVRQLQIARRLFQNFTLPAAGSGVHRDNLPPGIYSNNIHNTSIDRWSTPYFIHPVFGMLRQRTPPRTSMKGNARGEEPPEPAASSHFWLDCNHVGVFTSTGFVSIREHPVGKEAATYPAPTFAVIMLYAPLNWGAPGVGSENRKEAVTVLDVLESFLRYYDRFRLETKAERDVGQKFLGRFDARGDGEGNIMIRFDVNARQG